MWQTKNAWRSFRGSERGVRWKRVRALGGAVIALTALVTVAPTSLASASSDHDNAETGSMSVISQLTGAQAMWNSGFTGQGVDVALIDTGVALVPGLDRPGKVVLGSDLSVEASHSGTQGNDDFGHGTHMAGIIAGSDVDSGIASATCATCVGPSAYTDTTKFVGIAPDARIVNVKVGASDGSIDVARVIAGIEWVVQHRNDAGLNIRVLNVSFGFDALQPAESDPLAHTVEAAWAAGIVVVAAGGNDSDTPSSLTSPAYSPAVIAVGSIDPHGTLSTDDDTVADFTQHGTVDRRVDVAAPGVSVIGLRAPGSYVDLNVTTGKVGSRFQRASGTSQSTAVVSGLAALVLSKYPGANPDQVKTYLRFVASPLTPDEGNTAAFAGAGSANVTAVAAAPPAGTLGWLPTIGAAAAAGTGVGLIEAANASAQVEGEWTGARWTGARWTGARWTGARWTGARWTGARWTGAAGPGPAGPAPAGPAPAGPGRWTGARWTGARWTGARWTGARWT